MRVSVKSPMAVIAKVAYGYKFFRGNDCSCGRICRMPNEPKKERKHKEPLKINLDFETAVEMLMKVKPPIKEPAVKKQTPKKAKS